VFPVLKKNSGGYCPSKLEQKKSGEHLKTKGRSKSPKIKNGTVQEKKMKKKKTTDFKKLSMK
jgi:hypothetical protein